MGQELHIRAKGLHTDPNPHALPEGALRVAKNVVIRSDGVVEPRPGFSAQSSTPDQPPEYIAAYDGAYVAATRSESAWAYEQDDGTDILDEDGGAISFDAPERIDATEAAGNLYITTSSGVRRISAHDDTTAYLTGLPPAMQGIVATETSGDAIASGDAVAYRVTYRRKVGTRVMRSRPSGRFTYDNDTGGGIDLVLRIPVHPDAQPGDVVELWRTKAVSGADEDTSDTMFFVGDDDVTISTLWVEIPDEREDDELGAALYTNATQQGILQANDRPPKSRAVGSFQSMLFFGATKQPVTDSLSAPETMTIGIAGSGDTTDGNTTVSSVVIGAGSDTDLITEGMFVTDDGAASPEDSGTANIQTQTKVADIPSLSSIVLDKAAKGTETTAGLKFWHWLQINGDYIYFDQDGTSGDPDTTNRTVGGGTNQRIVQDVAHVINTNYADGGEFGVTAIAAGAHDGEMSLILIGDIDGTITWSQNQYRSMDYEDDAWRETEASFGLEDPPGERPNRAYYSKLDQPEHVPRQNFFAVGSESDPILRFVPLRDSLLVFKTDGIFRISGRTPQTLRVDPLDTDCVLIHPQCVDVLDNRAIAWTNRGIVAVSDVGVTPLSDPVIEGDLQDIQDAALKAIRDTSSDPEVSGLWLRAHYNRSEFYVGVPGDGSRGGGSISAGVTGTIYVFNSKTGAWTTWAPPVGVRPKSAAVDVVSDKLLLGGDGGVQQATTGTVYEERTGGSITAGLLAGEDFDTADEERSFTVDSVDTSTNTVTVSSVGSWIPSTCDALKLPISGEGFGNVWAPVLSATLDGATWDLVIPDASSVGTGGGTAYEGYPVEVEWTVKTARNPGMDKHWLETLLWFERYNTYAPTIEYTSYVSETADSLDLPTRDDITTRDNRRAEDRALVSTDHARGAFLYVKWLSCMGLQDFRLMGLSVWYDPMSRRVHT